MAIYLDISVQSETCTSDHLLFHVRLVFNMSYIHGEMRLG